MKFEDFKVTYPDRCARCFMRHSECLCHDIKVFPNQTKVTVVMHHREAYKTTNTVRLARLCLADCDVRLRGHPQLPLQLEQVIPNPEQCLYLTLSDRSEVLSPNLTNLSQFRHLVLPDENWRQAGRMGKREPILARMRWVKLEPGPLSEYLLRKEPSSEGLATIEAMAKALRIIEGDGVADHLIAAFRLMVQRTLKTRPKNRQLENLKHR